MCPYTYVKLKLALEEMEQGKVIEIITNHKPAVENIPNSMMNEGNEVLEVSQINQTDWKIMVRKVT